MAERPPWLLGPWLVVAVGDLVAGVGEGDRVAISPGFGPPGSEESLAGEHHLKSNDND